MSMDSQHRKSELDKFYRNYDNRFNFTVVSQCLATDSRLSFKARGLLLYMAAHNHAWKFYISRMVKDSAKDGRDSVRTALNELVKYGYLIRKTKRHHGRFDYEFKVNYVPDDIYKRLQSQYRDNH